MKTMKILKTPFSSPQQFMGYALFHIGSDLGSYTGKELFLSQLLSDMRLESIHRSDFDWRSLETGRLVLALGPANGERLLCSVCSVEEVEAEEMVVLVPKAVAYRVLSGDEPMTVDGSPVEPVQINHRQEDVTIVNRSLPIQAKSITFERLRQSLDALRQKGYMSSDDGDKLFELHGDESIRHGVGASTLATPESCFGSSGTVQVEPIHPLSPPLADGLPLHHIEDSGQALPGEGEAATLPPRKTEGASLPPIDLRLPPSHPDVRASTRNRGFRLIERRRMKEEGRMK